MTRGRRPAETMGYECSARRRVQYWALLVVGLIFAYAGSTIDPQSNCSADGECAPWLVPVAKWLGIVFAMGGALQLLVNPRSGSCIDPASGELLWWRDRTVRSPGKEGHIHPSRIGRIRIVRESESADGVHLYDLEGQRQAYFDSEVIPWPYDKWARRLIARWPHIRLDIEG